MFKNKPFLHEYSSINIYVVKIIKQIFFSKIKFKSKN